MRAALHAAAAKAIPELQHATVVGTYAGLRPGSDQSSDYIIESVAGASWITVAGIRSTGLTASLGIARHVAALCDDSAAGDPSSVRTTPLPPVAAIVDSFRERGDGTVIFGHDEMGFGAHYVTHPLTRAGFERLACRAGDRARI